MDRKRSPMKENMLTPVEKYAVDSSPFVNDYSPTEKIRTVVVDNFPALGKLAAMRFLEWVQSNPEGVVSLPTGKTPEHFIRWVIHLVNNWEDTEVQNDLKNWSLNTNKKPEMDKLHFVQIDDFYPIDPDQDNSFYSYVKRFYIEGFGMNPDKALLINYNEMGFTSDQDRDSLWPDGEVDLSLRYREPVTKQETEQQRVLMRVDQWCQEYEKRIRDLGGIGFFLGGIGPDGHIAFNVRGSDHHSTTRLTAVNYETQAAAAGDLGGIEISRKRLVITIGLGTITYNPDVCAIVIAAGEAKSKIIADAVQSNQDIQFPATALYNLKNSRFYITLGAAKHLRQRQLDLILIQKDLDNDTLEKIIIDVAVKLDKRIIDLTETDLRNDEFGAILLDRCPENTVELTKKIRDSLILKIEQGTKTYEDTRFLHTEPHHDDLMLGYWPYIVRNTRPASNTHYFSCLTGGFTAVTNQFVLNHIERLKEFIKTPDYDKLTDENYFDPESISGRNRDVWQYLDGIAANDLKMRSEGMARRFLRNLIELYGVMNQKLVEERISNLENYFTKQYPGQKDDQVIQRLKSMCREWEAECTWGYLGWGCESIKHLRLGFYTGDIFTQEPTVKSDVTPVINLLNEVKPNIVSVALDPEASGPDTHYKVLQAITEALRRFEKTQVKSELKVWGYRNVWFRFHPSEANIFVPVSLNMLSVMHNAFMNTFISQSEASFPSYEHDGPFSELARSVQVEQYQKLKVCLGRDWFQEHPSPMIRATRGFVFLKEMKLEEFYERSRSLMQVAENR